ncbi:MAG TPA: DNA-3-methyladenine glycosylase [Saprospiraceae bacterium]|nr:DNA-3-methyladenine glycosylase [Saprospiraceae bacterium]
MKEPSQILAHLSRDSRLKPILEHLPFPSFDPDREVFTSLLRSIVSQQLSVKAAATIHQRFLQLFEDLSPTSEQVLTCSTEDLRSVGLSRQKSHYVHNVAEFFEERKLQNQNWSALSDQAIIDLLTQIKGVGQWTVEMVLMFTLQRPDVLPVDDLGIQQAFAKLYGVNLDQKKRALFQEMREIAAPWSPYRTYASLYLWRYKDL